MTSRPLVNCLGLALTVVVSADALAQTAGQQKPPVAQPGQIERQFQRPPEPTARPGAVTIPDVSQKPPENAGSITIVLTQVNVEGVTRYRPDALRSAYANLLQKEVTLADVYRVAETLTAKYRNDGYILSQVFVPAQTIEGGVVRLQAVEGYIANVRVEGSTASTRDRLKKYGDKIRATRPLTMAALERYVLLANDLPGVVAQAVLAPSTVAGASDLILRLSRRRELSDLNSDNRGSTAQGPTRVLGDFNRDSLLGVGSRTEMRGVTTFTPELSYVAAAHDQFVGAEGGKVGLAASYVYSRPQELSIVPLNLLTRSTTATVSYGHPLVRRRSYNLYGRAVLSAFDSTTKVFGVNDTIDHVRALQLAVTYDFADGLHGLNVVDVAFTQGLNALGASHNGEQLLSRASGRVDFRKGALYVQRLQMLAPNWSVLVSGSGQYAFTDLLTSEMFSFGGELFGRGYDPSALLNDHGASAKVDLRYIHRWGATRPLTLMPYAFGDAGRVWVRTGLPGLSSWASAASAGAGVRMNVGSQFSGFVEVAKPFNVVVGSDQSRDPRVYAGVTVR